MSSPRPEDVSSSSACPPSRRNLCFKCPASGYALYYLRNARDAPTSRRRRSRRLQGCPCRRGGSVGPSDAIGKLRLQGAAKAPPPPSVTPIMLRALDMPRMRMRPRPKTFRRTRRTQLVALRARTSRPRAPRARSAVVQALGACLGVGPARRPSSSTSGAACSRAEACSAFCSSSMSRMKPSSSSSRLLVASCCALALTGAMWVFCAIARAPVLRPSREAASSTRSCRRGHAQPTIQRVTREYAEMVGRHRERRSKAGRDERSVDVQERR